MAKQIPDKVQTTFAHKKKKADGMWTLGPNVTYLLHVECDLRLSDGSTRKVQGLHQETTLFGRTGVTPPMVVVNDDWLELTLTVDWNFQNLLQAFADATCRTSRMLMVYSDVVRNNLVGDTKHPLLREVVYKCDGSESLYFEPLHVQWLPVCCLFVEVI